MNTANNFTEGKILAPLLRFSIPIFIAVFLQAMYGAVDLAVVGQFGDKADVSAVSTGSFVMVTVTSIIIGLTMGLTILLAQKIGEKNDKDAGNTVGSAILLFSAVGLALTLIMVFLARPLTSLMQAPPEAFEQTYLYILICSSGCIIITAFNAVSAVFRGMGNSNAPLLFVAIACVLNILGDLLLVGVFRLGPSGAAYATLFAQAVSVFFSFWLVKRKGFPFSFSRKNIRFHAGDIKAILRFGSPIALNETLTNISFLSVISILNGLGIIASAGVGIGEKYCVFMMLIPFAFSSSLAAFVAQNVGAGKHERAKKAMLYAMASSALIGLAVFSVTFFFGGVLAKAFTKETPVIAAAASYLKSYAIDSPLLAIYMCMIGYFNGYGKTLFTMLQGIFCAFLIRIPFAWLMSTLPGVTLFKVGLGTPLATTVGIIICFAYYKAAKWRREISITHPHLKAET